MTAAIGPKKRDPFLVLPLSTSAMPADEMTSRRFAIERMRSIAVPRGDAHA
jgi:hypothetical protein